MSTYWLIEQKRSGESAAEFYQGEADRGSSWTGNALEATRFHSEALAKEHLRACYDSEFIRERNLYVAEHVDCAGPDLASKEYLDIPAFLRKGTD